MTLHAMVELVVCVTKDRQRQENGRHTFKGMDAHSWHGAMVRQYRLSVQDREYADIYTAYAEEAKVISTTLQMLDNAKGDVQENPFYDLP